MLQPITVTYLYTLLKELFTHKMKLLSLFTNPHVGHIYIYIYMYIYSIYIFFTWIYLFTILIS